MEVYAVHGKSRGIQRPKEFEPEEFFVRFRVLKTPFQPTPLQQPYFSDILLLSN